MLIVFCLIAIGVLLGGVKVYQKSQSDGGEFGGIAMVFLGSACVLVVVIVFCVMAASLVQLRVVDQQIAMYEEQNAKIEGQIETVVKQYMEHEENIFLEVGDKESYITLVSLYPELKSDALVSKQIDLYMANNDKIVALKTQKLNAAVYKWWLYFGG